MLTAIAVGVLGWLAVATLREREAKSLHRAVAGIQRELESYASSHDGTYPTDLSAYIKRRGIELPANPCGSGRLRILSPTDKWQPGGLIYIGYGRVLKEGATPAEFEKSKGMVPDEVEGYVLMAYGTKAQGVAYPNDALELRDCFSSSAIGCGSYPVRSYSNSQMGAGRSGFSMVILPCLRVRGVMFSS